ncbi:transglycosylase SLT domain-containing protein [Cloacibacillus porcorum]|uniref:transglycosylase SLT domain-containing protein n=1 Tax=Cloacibacillus porcorum TaxID=1197717 RepID=UPI003C6C9008
MTKRAGIILTLIFISIGVILNVSDINKTRSLPRYRPSMAPAHRTHYDRTAHNMGGNKMSSVNNPKAHARILQYKNIAAHWSKQTGVPTALILAIIDQESDGRAEATRYEPGYKPSPTHKPAMDKAGVPIVVQKTSYGLMQMMFPVAWGYGARNTIELRTPHVAIRYGAATSRHWLKDFQSPLHGPQPSSEKLRRATTAVNPPANTRQTCSSSTKNIKRSVRHNV